MWVYTYIDKPIFVYFGQFSKRLSDCKHSYLCQMTTKNFKPIYQNLSCSLLVQIYFNFENSSSIVHFTLDQTGVLFWVTRYINDLPKPHHRQNSRSQFAYHTGLWAASKNIQFAAKLLCKDLRKLAKWCANGE